MRNDGKVILVTALEIQWLSLVPVTTGVALSYSVLKTLHHGNHSSTENIPSGTGWINVCHDSGKVPTLTEKLEKSGGFANFKEQL